MKIQVLICISIAVLSANAFRFPFLGQEPAEKVEFDPEKMNEYFLAFLKGLKADQYVTNSTACVVISNQLAEEMAGAIEDFNNNKLSRYEAYLSLAKAMQMISPVVKVCYSVSDSAFDQMAKHFEQFKTLQSFWHSFFLNAIANTALVQQDIFEFQDCANQRNPNITCEFYITGEMLHLLFDFDVIKSPLMALFADKDAHDLFENAADFVAGFLNGTEIIPEDGNVYKCDSNIHKIDETVRDAIEELQGNSRTKYRDFAFDLADVFNYPYPIMLTCHDAYADFVTAVQEYEFLLENPTQILLNIIYNFDDIAKYASLFVKEAQKKDFNSAQIGYNLGEVIYYIFFINKA